MYSLSEEAILPPRPPVRLCPCERCIYNFMSDSDECRRSDRFTLLPLGTEADASPASANAQTRAEPGGQEGAAGERPGAAASGVSAIKSVHFTQSCTKPWFCAKRAVREKLNLPGGCCGAHCGYRDSVVDCRAGTSICGRIFHLRVV